LSNRDRQPQKQNAAQGVGSPRGGKAEPKAANFHAQEYVGVRRSAITKLPSRAKLARKWPKLRINRLTWHWRDDACGAKGDDFQSLLVYLGEGA
jgi:hypothetical protein